MLKAWVPKLSTSAWRPVERSARSTALGIVLANGRLSPYTTDEPSTATRRTPGAGAAA